MGESISACHARKKKGGKKSISGQKDLIRFHCVLKGEEVQAKRKKNKKEKIARDNLDGEGFRVLIKGGGTA